METRYPRIDKVALALVISARKLQPYFQSHTIVVLTDQLLGKVLQSLDASGRLVNWSVELREFDIKYRAHAAIKAQALSDFVVECTVPEDPPQLVLSEVLDPWLLYVDGSSKARSSGAGVILISPEKFMIKYALRFNFQVSNNEAEYEALLARIRLAHSLRVDSLSVHSDSQLVVNHILGEYGAKDDRMAQYLQEVKTEAAKLKKFAIRHIPRNQNAKADSLSKLTSADIWEFSRAIYIEFLRERSIQFSKEIDVVEYEPCWMDPIIQFLISGTFYEGLSIALRFTFVAHPQSNGQTENMNHSFLQGLKRKLDNAKGAWVDELLKDRGTAARGSGPPHGSSVAVF
ncbi:hypothetical protein RJ639_013198 [Escallonia herrerae]|uniref:RNase H type-1 domain-containing protein n=1 Tax=Escallonia herrerae TaxID=1293975 RepID=A0AA88VFR1_9ASTE|nr:hypothetical protein RJ639_013198 [Escallonia herrerae]